MNPSDTQIERMADYFSTRFVEEGTTSSTARAAWQRVLTYARNSRILHLIEEQMTREAPSDARVRTLWERTRG